MTRTVYPKKYAHGFVVLCFVVVMQSFIINSHEVFIHIHQGCFAGTGAIVRLPQCQWNKPDGYGKISQCITTTKHSKAKTVCIFIGIYCYGILKYDINTLWSCKMAAILQTTFSNAFSWLKIYKFWLLFHWTLFLRVQWLGTDQATGHYLIQLWFDYRRIYAALSSDHFNRENLKAIVLLLWCKIAGNCSCTPWQYDSMLSKYKVIHLETLSIPLPSDVNSTSICCHLSLAHLVTFGSTWISRDSL